MSKNLEQSYVDLIQKHEGIIHKVIGLYVDHVEDQKDLKQEIMLQGWQSFKNFKGQSQFSTWLYKVALNTVLNFRKRKKFSEDLDKAKGVKTEPTTNDDQEILLRVIKSLDEIDRMLMTLHLEGYKNIEIADITGMTQNHVNVKLHRLKQTVIDHFKVLHDGSKR